MQQPIIKPTVTRNGAINSVQKADLPIHGWYRFVLSYPPHLVRQYIDAFGVKATDLICDPFCGTGTTLVEAKRSVIASVGCDAHPMAALVSRVKTNWTLDGCEIRSTVRRILRCAEEKSGEHGLGALSFEAKLFHDRKRSSTNGFHLTEDEEKLLPTGFLSQRPLQRLLILRDEIDEQTQESSPEIQEFLLVALAHVIANGAGNFAFGPEIYRTKPKPDYDVLGHFARQTDLMISELAAVQESGLANVPSKVFSDDARQLSKVPGDISAVITSPPYPNEKDYTRTTRVESILLGLVTDRASLRGVKESLLRSNTRNVFVTDSDLMHVKEFSSIQRICEQIEARRIELKKTSGFEKLYYKVVAHYFGGMRLHFRALKPKLRKAAKLAYVVGDQMSFLMVNIPTARLLAEIAEAEGYKVSGCDLWRERVGTKVRNCPEKRKIIRVREEVLLL